MSSYAFQCLTKLGLSERIAQIAAPKMGVVSYESGELIQYSDPKKACWQVIINGVVTVSAGGTDKARVPVAIFGPDMWFGHEALIDSSSLHREYFCLSPVETLQMPATVFCQLLNDEPDFAFIVLKLSIWRWQRDQEVSALLKTGTHALRVVMGLAESVESISTCGGICAASSFDSPVLIQFGQILLAKSFGVSRTILSDCLQKLSDSGWLNIQYRGIELLQPLAWLKFIENRRSRGAALNKATMDELLRELDFAALEVKDEFEYICNDEVAQDVLYTLSDFKRVGQRTKLLGRRERQHELLDAPLLPKLHNADLIVLRGHSREQALE